MSPLSIGGKPLTLGMERRSDERKTADLWRELVRLMLFVTLNQDKSDKLERPFQVGAGEMWRRRRVAAGRLNSRSESGAR